ncbi:diguanylate cyclase/phosphodiesterase (GGDEF & EAL domains) with PAS/PAC sensor(s) [hydrothermal vent metagenome]|uniref:Diguanylate cyclase/phosphodiesterase (GGDEF & EAL domains) with PAS/PAC sensor(S) n=1 Tax=hydrothermal vent metagenome TaxID=652676 RepID=A0A3B1ATQ6_9ZZZZ
MSTNIVNAVDSGIIVIDPSGGILVWNDWMQQNYGIASETALGKNLNELFPAPRNAILLEAVGHCLSTPTAAPSIISGELFPVTVAGGKTSSGHPMQNATIKPLTVNGSSGTCLVQVHDKHIELCAPDILREKERLEVTLASISDAVIITNDEKQIEFLNAAAEQLCGWKSENAVGLCLDTVLNMTSEASNLDPDLFHGDNEFKYLDAGLILISASGTHFPIELSVAGIPGEPGTDAGSVVVFRDISHSQRMEERLFWQINHDSLTGLENRSQFEHRLHSLLITQEAKHQEHALLYLDLDQFKIVNDTCGHAAGDELLREITSVLKYKIRQSDSLARLGGDEFGVLLPNCPLDAALRIANGLRKVVKNFRFAWEGKIFALGISIGLVPFNGSTEDASNIMISADTACITAKDEGRNRVHVFKHGDSAASRRHSEMQWVSHIQSALDNNRLTLHRQTIVPLSKQGTTPSHQEVLVRLFDEDGTLIPPGAFIPAAERYNLMPEVDRWVITATFKHLSKSLSNGTATDLLITNINLSGTSFMEEGFLEFIINQLEKFAIPPEIICLEVTETSTIANLDEALSFINALREIGCKFALDDFGSGLSSFGYLKHLPVDYLKIDGSFIKDILQDPIHSAMVEAINQIGHVMGIQTVAEFVEDEATMTRLREMGIDFAQGYHIDKPSPL